MYGDRGRSDSDEEQPRVVIRDKRRIDPETGAVRDTSPASPSDSSVSGGNVTGAPPSAAETAAKELAERTEDLQRVSAEYANYRRRVDRDRVLIGQMAQERLVMDLLPVMDDLDRARDHGDLTGAFKSTADQLTAVLDRAGVEAFGEVGDPFDPGLHEAVLHSESPDVAVPTCTHVMRRGYRRGDRVLRAAMVGVADPANPAPVTPAGTESAESGTAPESTGPAGSTGFTGSTVDDANDTEG
ncbi:MAG: nucleotide exchange factor GrpE [Geodermatophilaceae bacterium]|nr:nucleotide exchange factor GrpE [Geodermatophilaceae bacterium]